MNEFSYLNYYTVYRASIERGNEIVRNNAACFRDCLNKEEYRYSSRIYNGTYELTIFKEKSMLSQQRNNACFLTKKQLNDHVKKCNNLIDSFEYSIEDNRSDRFIVKLKVRGTNLQHRYVLNWVRYAYEFPANMILLDAVKAVNQFPFKSIATLVGVFATTLNPDGNGGFYGEQQITKGRNFPKQMTNKQLKERLANTEVSQKINDVYEYIPNSRRFDERMPDAVVNGRMCTKNDLIFWLSEEGFNKRLEVYKKVMKKYDQSLRSR